MAGSFSGHLINSYMSQSVGPFGQPSNLAVNGLVSFNPSIHRTPSVSALGEDISYAELSQETAQKIASLQAKLNQKLGPEYLSQRPGPGGGVKLTYIEGWKVINVANEVFGFNGWSSSVVNLTTDYMDYNEQNQRYNVGVTAIVRVTLRDGVFHEDIGYGTIDNAKGKGAALDKCKKEAVTDALKRALRAFGNLLGNCLYDKSYVNEVVKIKVPQQKFDKSELYRRPEFEERSASVKTEQVSVPAPRPQPQAYRRPEFEERSASVKTEQISAPAPRPQPQAQVQPKPANQTPKGPSYPPGMGPPGGATGLNTPITTPQHQSRASSRLAPAAVPRAAQPAPPAAAPPPPQPPPIPEPTTEVGSDEFTFYSDDEAILANVDAEVDMGRPIVGESPFEEQESLDVSMMSTTTATTTNGSGSSLNWTMPPPPPPPPNLDNTTTISRSSSTTPQLPRGGFMSGASSSSSAGGSSAVGAGTGNPRGGFISNGSSSGTTGHSSRSGGFMTASSSTSNTHGGNTPTPSTRIPGGGFHFPAGVTHAHEQLQRTPLAPLPISNQSCSSSSSAAYPSNGVGVGVGMKRKADSGVDPGGGGGGGGGGRRMGPGMGLLHSSRPLNQNHFGGGDDTKRVKR